MPMAPSSYGTLNFMSVLHATYLRCIRPYVNSQTVALEIGPGRGAWTKALLNSKEVWALDALSAEHNRFFEYLGNPSNVRYFQVHDLECKMLPDDFFTYMFSFGCLCHVSFEGITQYAANLYSKLRSGSNCFWLVGDYEKYNAAVATQESLSIARYVVPSRKRYKPLQWLVRRLERKFVGESLTPLGLEGDDDKPSPGRWYNAGTKRTCEMLVARGYRIIDSDVGTVHRDPIIHFGKP
jgi:phospholipid N-methyltransferase